LLLLANEVPLRSAVNRDVRLDTWRGIAIILMIFDHALMACGVPLVLCGFGWIRCTITRLACPIFFVVAGRLWQKKRPSFARIKTIVLCSPLTSYFLFDLGAPPFDILLQYVILALLLSRLVVAYPVACAVVGVVQSLYLPVPTSFGYHFGTLVTYLSIGVLSSGQPVPRVSFPKSFQLLCTFSGRHPLSMYVLHIPILLLIREFWHFAAE
jgi:uncharacterized membrane protein